MLLKETHKISNARQLVDAIFSNGGPKNTKMCVLRIDKNLAKLEGVRKINNISYYHTIDFKEFYKEYFDIGNGKFYKFNGVLMCVISQFWLTKVFFRTDVTFVNGASVVVDWISSQVQDKSMMFNSSQSIPCPEALWICEFESEDDAINHVSTGNHKYAKIQNGIDKALSYFVQQKHILNIRNDSTSPGNLAHSVESANSFCKLGMGTENS